jgi:hypothetical protein
MTGSDAIHHFLSSSRAVMAGYASANPPYGLTHEGGRSGRFLVSGNELIGNVVQIPADEVRLRTDA